MAISGLTKMVDGKCVPLTDAEVAEFIAAEAAWIRDKRNRLLEGVRTQRDELLAACDYTQLPDYPGEDKELWAQYRQDLRDVTEQKDLEAVVWPKAPVK